MKTFKKLLTPAVYFLIACSLNLSAQTTVTDITAAGLQTDFNALNGNTRIIFIGDPNCGACVAHVNNLMTMVFAQCNNPNLRGMIVWVNTSSIGTSYNALKSDAVTEAGFYNDPRVQFYWNTPTDDIPQAFGNASWTGCVYTWDISMVFSDTTTWTGTSPSAPYYCTSKIVNCCTAYNMTNEYNMIVANADCSASAITDFFSSQTPFKIYPNPVADQATFVMNTLHSEKPTRLEIRSLDGTLVYKEQVDKNILPWNVNTSSFAQGIYYCRIVNDNGVSAGVKMIVMH